MMVIDAGSTVPSLTSRNVINRSAVSLTSRSLLVTENNSGKDKHRLVEHVRSGKCLPTACELGSGGTETASAAEDGAAVATGRWTARPVSEAVTTIRRCV